jgi:hypothetical protein
VFSVCGLASLLGCRPIRVRIVKIEFHSNNNNLGKDQLS